MKAPFADRAAGWLLPVLGTLALAVLVSRLDADAPARFPIDHALDEGYWLHNARSRVLFGIWAPDEFNQGLVTAPLHTIVAAASFRILGVTFWAGRLPSVLATLATAGILWSMSRRDGPARLAPWILLTSSFVMGHAHVALAEPLCGTLVMLAVATALRAPSVRGAVLSGACLGLAALAKPVALAMLPATFLDLLLAEGPRRRPPWLHLLSASGVYGSVAVPFLIAHRDELGVLRQLLAQASGWHGPARALRNAFDVTVVVSPEGGLVPCDLIRLSPALAVGLVLGASRASRAVRLMSFAAAVGAASVAFLDNRPARRFYLLAAPAAYLTSHLLLGTVLPSRRRAALACVCGTAFAANLVERLGRPWLPSGLGPEGIAAIVAAGLVLAAPLVGARRLGSIVLLRLVILAALTLDGIAGAIVDPLRASATVRDASRALASTVADGIVAGSAAPTLCLETRARSCRTVGPWRGRILNQAQLEQADFVLVTQEVFGSAFADPISVRPGTPHRDIGLLPGRDRRSRLVVRLYETRSMSIAAPWPTATHSVASP